MTIFSRRVIQRILDENRLFLSKEQVDNHVKLLNSNNDDVIPTEWEVVILNSLNKIGRVEHEKNLGGTSYPDIYFISSGGDEFVADITAISDDQYDKENPKSYFLDTLRKLFNKNGLSMNGLSIRIDDRKVGKYRASKIKLCLPPKKDIPSFVKREFYPIVKEIKSNPLKSLNKRIDNVNASMSVAYSPNKNYFEGGHASYTTLYSLKSNPIYNRVKKKITQLKKSAYQGVMGIIICDACCDSLNCDYIIPPEISQKEIIDSILKNYSTISFVMVLTPEEEQYQNIIGKRQKYYKVKIQINEKAKYPLSQELFLVLDNIKNILPTPEAMPVNAKSYLKLHKDEGRSKYGGLQFSDNSIKFSSRTITELFAGILSFDKFDEDQKAMTRDGRNDIMYFFKRNFDAGRMISEIKVEKCENEDDDWVEITFGESDAAISMYK